MRWATWKRVGIDRMACAWLILRFIDPDAAFVFVDFWDEMPEDAVPFDTPGVRFTHRRGECTFATMVREHGLRDASLGRLADIITAADVPGNFFDHPESAGLDAVCRGVSLISEDDHAAIKQGLVIFDGLYRLFSADVEAPRED